MKPLRAATDRDWRCFYGVNPPAHWSGIVAEDDHMILGIGGLYADRQGRWWAFLRRAPGVRGSVTAQRAAMAILDAARDADLVVNAISDPAIAGSGNWLQRLGFEEIEDIEGYRRWTR